MVNLSERVFLCFAWEDLAEVQSFVADMEHELDAKTMPVSEIELNFEANEQKIDTAEVFVVFISTASKKTDYVKQCVVRAQHLNKNIIPIEIGKTSFLESMPPEFKFRTKPYVYRNEESRAKLFAQLKASFGFNIEDGDEYGCVVHIVTDIDANIFRYGELLGTAKANEDYKIRLTKGAHLLDFVSLSDAGIRYSTSYKVENNDGEQFLSLPLADLLKKKQEEEEKALKDAEMKRKYEEEKAIREAEIKRKFDEEQYQKNLELEQKEREIALKREQQAIAVRERQQEMEFRKQQEKEQSSKSKNGCWIIVIIVLGIAAPWTLLISLPWYFLKKKKK